MKELNIGSVGVNLNDSDRIHGLVLKRELTLKESQYVMGNILGVPLKTRKVFDDIFDWNVYKGTLMKCTNSWLEGSMDLDSAACCVMSECMRTSFNMMNFLLVVDYLKRKDVLD